MPSSVQRTITIKIDGKIGQSDYANLANMVWMMMRSLPYGRVTVEHDDQVTNDYLNAAWERYGRTHRWGEA